MRIDMRKQKPRRLKKDQFWVTCDDGGVTNAKAVVSGVGTPVKAAEGAAGAFRMYMDGTVLVEDSAGRTHRIRVSVSFDPEYSGRDMK